MGRKKLPEDRGRTTFTQVRLTPPFKAWLAAYAEHVGLSITGAIVRALVAAAKRDKFRQPPDQ